MLILILSSLRCVHYDIISYVIVLRLLEFRFTILLDETTMVLAMQFIFRMRDFLVIDGKVLCHRQEVSSSVIITYIVFINMLTFSSFVTRNNR